MVDGGNEMSTAVKSKRKSRSQTQRPQETNSERPIWEVVAEIGSQISDEEWEKVPDDSAINYKHHLYGTPVKHV